MVLADCPIAQYVLQRVTRLGLLFDTVRCAAKEYVHDYIGLVKASFFALIDCSFHIDIVDGASVHKGAFAFPVMRREYKRNRGGGDCRIGQLRKGNIILSPLGVLAIVHIDGRDNDSALDLVKLGSKRLKVLEQRRVVHGATLESHSTDFAKGPVFPDVAGMQVFPQVGHPLR